MPRGMQASAPMTTRAGKACTICCRPSCTCGSRCSIYARLRATCDWLAGRLADADIDCAAYHAGKDSEQRGKVRC